MISAARTKIKPSPDFSCDLADRCKYDAGLRPWREDSYRLEPVQMNGKLLIHNYGHGGAGISMSWGCADAVRKIVTQTYSPGPAHTIAVLGAGVMGLTAASLLTEAGFAVRIFAEKIDRTTSDVAGGQWAPSIVEHYPAKTIEFYDLLKVAYGMHKARLGRVYGVSERVNYCLRPAAGLEKAVKAHVIPKPKNLLSLPFEHLSKPGLAYETLLVEPPIFLGRLRAELRPHVPFIQRSFISEQEVWGLAEPIVINCTGLGSRKLFQDLRLKPKKGQLVLLKPQSALDYLYSTGTTYVFPRADHVVVGGSQEDDNYDCTPDPGLCQMILATADKVFNGRSARVPAHKHWMIRDK